MDFYADLGVPYAFDIELPDLGDLGMLLPPSDIIEVSKKDKLNRGHLTEGYALYG
jgi:hypothetical protein